MKIELKKTKQEDFSKLAKICVEEFSKQPYNEPWTTQKALKKLEIFSRYCDIWNVLYEKGIIGFIIVNPNQWCPGEIAFGEEMAINSQYQNKGIGTEVLKEITAIYKNKGFSKFMGITNTNSKNFYIHQKLGFKESNNKVMEKEI